MRHRLRKVIEEVVYPPEAVVEAQDQKDTSPTERDQLIQWLEEDGNRYELLFGVENDADGDHFERVPLRTLRRVKEVIQEIDAAIEAAVKRIHKLGRSRLGVGETGTDEAIAGEFYNQLH